MDLRQFFADESGAVTVDWIVLTASIVGLGIATVSAVRTGTNALAADISNSLTAANVNALTGLDGFTFTRHGAEALANVWSTVRGRSDADLTAFADWQTNNALAALEEGNTNMATMWMERRYISEQVMSERGITVPQTAQSAAELTTQIQAAGG